MFNFAEAPNFVVPSDGESGGVSRASSKAASRDVTRPTSAIENNIDYFKEPVVKVCTVSCLNLEIRKIKILDYLN